MALVRHYLLLARYPLVSAPMVAGLLMNPETKAAIGNMAELADLVEKAHAAYHPDLAVGRPEGGITIKEYSMLKGVSISAASRHLNELVKRGKYEQLEAVALSTYSHRLLRQMFYREVKR